MMIIKNLNIKKGNINNIKSIIHHRNLYLLQKKDNILNNLIDQDQEKKIKNISKKNKKKIKIKIKIKNIKNKNIDQ